MYAKRHNYPNQCWTVEITEHKRIYNDITIRYVRRKDKINTDLLQENLGALYRLSRVLRNNYLIDNTRGIESLRTLQKYNYVQIKKGLKKNYL